MPASSHFNLLSDTMRVTNRFAAFAIHLGISVLMFLVLVAIIKFLWYPGVLFETEGGWEGIKLIAGVDLVIGPTLTLMVYNVAKKELRRDLAVIGLLQTLCIVGGMSTVAYTRPVAVVYAVGTFFVATRQRYENHDIDIDDIPLLDTRRPAWLSVEIPTQQPDRQNFLNTWVAKGGFDLAIDHYQKFSSALSLLATEGQEFPALEKAGYKISPAMKEDGALRVFTLVTRYGTHPVVCDIRDGKVIAVLYKP